MAMARGPAQSLLVGSGIVIDKAIGVDIAFGLVLAPSACG